MIIRAKTILDFLKKEQIQFSFKGDSSLAINGFCSIKRPKENKISWVKNLDSIDFSCFDGVDSMLLVSSELFKELSNYSYIITSEPKRVFFSILNHFFSKSKNTGIAEDSVILTSQLGNDVSIGHHCFIGPEVEIGDNTIIEHNVTIINKVKIGSNCLLHSGIVIGTDGYGYFYNENNIPTKVDHFGGVLIGNNVEIGANTCIDRGTIDDTIISNNVKIDNLCHIGHNVIIEDNSMIVALALLGGSSHIKNNSYVAPCAVVKNQLSVGPNALVGMGAVVTRDVPAEAIVAGVPAKIVRYGGKEKLV